MVLKVLDVDGAVRRVKGGWVGTGEPWEYDEARYRKLDEARKREQQAMLDYQSTDGCRMAFLRGQLDDPELVDGRALRPLRQLHGSRVTAAAVDAACGGGHPRAADASRRRDHARASSGRRGWPSSASASAARSATVPAPGRVIGRLTDLGWGARLRRLLDEPDGEVPDDVVQAAVKVLASWDWETRPTAVLALDSDRHPLLIALAGARAGPARPADRSRRAAVRARSAGR